jgi:hypothetical protein
MKRRVAVWTVLCSLAAPACLAAQGTADSTFWRAVGRAASGGPKSQSLRLDPHIGRGNSYRLPPTTQQHSGTTLSILRDASGGRVAKSQDVIRCASRSRLSCRFVDGAALLAVGAPTFSGDTAFVRLYFALETNEQRMPVNEQDYLLILIRDGRDWKVVERRLIRIS